LCIVVSPNKVQQLQERLQRVEASDHDASHHESDNEVSSEDGEDLNPFHQARSQASSDNTPPHPRDLRLHNVQRHYDVKVDIPEFEGRMQPDEFIDWLNTIERIFEYKDVPEHHKVKLVAIKLRKHASLWWEHVKKQRERERKSRIVTWEKMKKALKRKFLPDHYRQDAFLKFHNFWQNELSVEDYTAEFDHSMMRCDIVEPEEQMVARYLGGLRSEISNVVQLQPYWTSLSACTTLKNLELGKEIHSSIGNELEVTIIISNALLDMYAKCGCLSIARQIFDEMPKKNVICWTSMVSGYVNCGQLDEARELFERSPVRDIILWTAMINGYVQFNRFDEAVALFREMQIRSVKPDKFILVALLTGCAQLGALEQGTWIHGYIDENRIMVDAIVGTALIEMYAKCGHVEKSLEVFCGLKEKDIAAWTSMIYGLAMNGKTSKALELFSEMKQAGAKPDDITFIGVLSACNHGGLIEEGRHFFNSMTKEYKIEPKLEHYGCLIDLLGRAGKLDEAEELIEEVPKENSEIIVPLYGSLLSACRVHGNVEMGERVAEWLVKIESSDSTSHTLLANIYASSDRWEDVMKVRRKMKNLGVKKVPGCSSIEVNGIVH
jgi:pentatricopeptide repeat protein